MLGTSTRTRRSRQRSTPTHPLRTRACPIPHGQLGRLLGAFALFEIGNLSAHPARYRLDHSGPRAPDHHADRARALHRLRHRRCVLPPGKACDRFGRRGPLLVLAAGLAPEHLRGSACELPATVQAGGNVIASTIAGLLHAIASPAVAFGCVAACMALALAALARAAKFTPSVFYATGLGGQEPNAVRTGPRPAHPWSSVPSIVSRRYTCLPVTGSSPAYGRHAGTHAPAHAQAGRRTILKRKKPQVNCCAPGEIRTHTGRVLNPLPLPIGLRGRGVAGPGVRRTRGAPR